MSSKNRKEPSIPRKFSNWCDDKYFKQGRDAHPAQREYVHSVVHYAFSAKQLVWNWNATKAGSEFRRANDKLGFALKNTF